MRATNSLSLVLVSSVMVYIYLLWITRVGSQKKETAPCAGVVLEFSVSGLNIPFGIPILTIMEQREIESALVGMKYVLMEFLHVHLSNKLYNSDSLSTASMVTRRTSPIQP